MIISKTPTRITFLGGGTDYPEWYKHHGGAFLSMAIDKYCYILARFLPPYFDYKSRFVYYKTERPVGNDLIKHPAIRECLKTLGMNEGLELIHFADLMSQRGLGASSSFIVGLLKCLYKLKGEESSGLLKEATDISRKMIRETVGLQDQVMAIYGGFLFGEIGQNGSVKTTKLKSDSFLEWLLLMDTGTSHQSSTEAQALIKQMSRKSLEITRMQSLAYKGLQLLEDKSYVVFGKLMDENWLIKRSLTETMSNPAIDNIYERAKKAGVLGGKLMGAGAGGYMLFVAHPRSHQEIKQSLKEFKFIPFKESYAGSHIIYQDSF